MYRRHAFKSSPTRKRAVWETGHHRYAMRRISNRIAWTIRREPQTAGILGKLNLVLHHGWVPEVPQLHTEDIPLPMMLCVALVSCTAVAELSFSAEQVMTWKRYARRHWSNVCTAHVYFRYSVCGLEGSGRGSIVQPNRIRLAGHHMKECWEPDASARKKADRARNILFGDV